MYVLYCRYLHYYHHFTILLHTKVRQHTKANCQKSVDTKVNKQMCGDDLGTPLHSAASWGLAEGASKNGLDAGNQFIQFIQPNQHNYNPTKGYSKGDLRDNEWHGIQWTRFEKLWFEKNMKQIGHRSHIFAIFLLPFSYGLGAIGLGVSSWWIFFFWEGERWWAFIHHSDSFIKNGCPVKPFSLEIAKFDLAT